MEISSNKNSGLFKGWNELSQNLRLLFSSTALNSISQGIFIVVFNLYILEMDISTNTLGIILAAASYAQALGSIPVGFLMEIIGLKKMYIIISVLAAVTKIIQVGTPISSIITVASFIGGLAIAGDFVIRLPFLEVNSTPSQQNKVHSISSVLMAIYSAIGSLIGGFAPKILTNLLSIDLVYSYRYTLYFSGLLAVLAVLPLLKIIDQPVQHHRKISLKPYLWGLDKLTIYVSLASLFIGLGLGIMNTFLNVIFVKNLGTSLEFFGTISALSIIPSIAITLLGPVLANAIGLVRSVTYMRSAASLSLVGLALTSSPWLGSIYFWFVRALTGASQPLSFSYAMQASKPKDKGAASAWLNVTYWFGNGIAANLGGLLITGLRYRLLLFIGVFFVLLAGLSNFYFFRNNEIKTTNSESVEAGS